MVTISRWSRCELCGLERSTTDPITDLLLHIAIMHGRVGVVGRHEPPRPIEVWTWRPAKPTEGRSTT